MYICRYVLCVCVLPYYVSRYMFMDTCMYVCMYK